MYLPVEEREWYGGGNPIISNEPDWCSRCWGNCAAVAYPGENVGALEPLHGSAAPVMLDVYGRSVDQDVYSKQGSGALEPVPPMDSVDTLRDLQP